MHRNRSGKSLHVPRVPAFQVGECGEECRTAAKACELAMGDSDTTLAELIISKSPSAAAISAWLCNGDGGVSCAKASPPVPEHRPKGPEFVALTEDELQLRATTRSMT